MHRNHLTAHCATAAIAAALALGSTVAFAQDAGEAVSPPSAVQVQPSPQVAPQTVTQPQTVQTVTQSPQAVTPASPAPVQPITVAPALDTQPVPVTAPVAPTAVPAPAPEAATAPRPAARTTATTPQAPVERAAPAPVAPDPAIASDPLATGEGSATETLEGAVVPPYAASADPAATVADTPAPESSDNTLGYMLGALAVLAVPLFAILAILPARRRRKALAKPQPGVATAEPPTRTEWPVDHVTPVTVGVPAATVTSAPVTQGPYDNPVAAFSHASASVRGALPASGAAVPLPARMPEDFEERDALLKRMAAARPDRANPFRHYKARIKRARLILQSLGRKFENVDPWIDLSEYPNNWPELARRKYLRAA